MSTKLGDQNSEEWDRIKSFVGGANKPSKHPIQQEMERIQMRKPQHLDEGGIVDPLSDPTKQILAPQGAGIMTPSPYQAAPNPQTPSPIAAQPRSQPSLPPQIPQMAAPMPTPTTPDTSYDQEASKILGNTPQGLGSALQQINTPTIGQRVGSGLSGFADALSRAGGSNSDYQKNFDTNQQQTRENLSKIPGQVSAAGKEQYGLSHELESYDPNSPFSKVTQNAYSQTLRQLGATPAQIRSMPAAVINEVVGHKVTLEEALARIKETGAYQQGMLSLQKATLGNTEKHQRAEEDLAHREQAEKEDTEASKHYILHPFNAAKAADRLSEGSGSHGIPDLGSTFNGQKVISVKRIR
jgi:hypothetical protein